MKRTEKPVTNGTSVAYTIRYSTGSRSNARTQNTSIAVDLYLYISNIYECGNSPSGTASRERAVMYQTKSTYVPINATNT